MDSIVSSVLSALNIYHQRAEIDKNSLLAGKILTYSANSATANTALTGAITGLTSAQPNANLYEILNLTVYPADASSVTAILTIRLNQ
jgi:hypothetical protein